MPLRVRYTIEQVIDGDENSTLDDIRSAVKQKGLEVHDTMMLTTDGVTIAAGEPLADYIQDSRFPTRALDIYQTADGLCQLRVENETGNAHHVLISLEGTIKDHKARIEEEYDLPTETQNLMLDDLELSNDYRLPDMVFTEGRTLELWTRVTTNIDVDLHTTTGRVIPIATTTTTYVADFKKQIHEAEGIEPECLRLYFRGQKLHDDNVLGYYGIKDWTTISLFVVTAGGSRTPSKAGIMDE